MKNHFFYQCAVRAPKIVDRVCKIFADINLSVWVCDLVDYLHSLIVLPQPHKQKKPHWRGLGELEKAGFITLVFQF